MLCVLQLGPPQVEMDELHEEAQRYAVDLKQGKVAEGKEALHGVAEDGTIATRLRCLVPNVSTIFFCGVLATTMSGITTRVFP